MREHSCLCRERGRAPRLVTDGMTVGREGHPQGGPCNVSFMLSPFCSSDSWEGLPYATEAHAEETTLFQFLPPYSGAIANDFRKYPVGQVTKWHQSNPFRMNDECGCLPMNGGKAPIVIMEIAAYVCRPLRTSLRRFVTRLVQVPACTTSCAAGRWLIEVYVTPNRSPRFVYTANRPVRFEEVDHGLQIPTNILFGSKRAVVQSQPLDITPA